MKKTFTKPKIEIVFVNDDVIKTSGESRIPDDWLLDENYEEN